MSRQPTDPVAVLARAMPEDELLTRILDLLELYGWWAYHVRNSRAGVVQGQVGFPDLIAVKHRVLLAVELKREGAQPTPAQLDWLQRLQDAGAEVRCWMPHHYLSGLVGRELDALSRRAE